ERRRLLFMEWAESTKILRSRLLQGDVVADDADDVRLLLHRICKIARLRHKSSESHDSTGIVTQNRMRCTYRLPESRKFLWITRAGMWTNFEKRGRNGRPRFQATGLGAGGPCRPSSGTRSRGPILPACRERSCSSWDVQT